MRRISIFGIAMTVAALVVAVSVGSGFEREYTRALLEFNSHIIIASTGELSDAASVIEKINSFNELEGAGRISRIEPFLYREGLGIASGKIYGLIFKGVFPERMSDDRGIEFIKKDGLDDDGGVRIFLGQAAYEHFDRPDSLKVMIPSEDGGKFVEVRIAGTFKTGINDFDAEFAIADIDSIKRLFGVSGDAISGLELWLDTPAVAANVASGLEGHLGPLYDIMTWEQLNGELLTAVRMERFVSAIIMLLMVFVALLNIVAVMVLITISRLESLSIMRALGLTKASVRSIFVTAGMFIVSWGIVLGLATGVTIAVIAGKYRLIPLDASIYLIDALPVELPLATCLILSIFCIVLGYLTSYAAANRLAGVDILKGLRIAG
jgi:lipoprotein-releasing system permease protein